MLEFDQELLEIYGELDRDRLMALVVRYARDSLDAGGSSIFLRDDITGRYVLRGTTGLVESVKMPAERIEYAPGEGLTGWIVKHGHALRIANVRDNEELRGIAKDLVWSKKYSEIHAEVGLAYLAVPILAKEGTVVLGVLRVSGGGEGQQFDEHDERLLSHMAGMVRIAIENSQRYEREKRRARYFRLLLDIGAELDPRRPVGEMLQAVVTRVRKGFRTEACQIYLRDEVNSSHVVLRAASGLPEGLVGTLAHRVGEGLTGHIISTEAPLQLREAAVLAGWDDPCITEVGSHLPSGAYRSFLGIPLRLGNEVHGTLEVINKIPSGPGHRDWFTHNDEEYLRLLSTAICAVLEGARYLKTLGDVGVTAMRMQRVASFGTVAQRMRHEAANPLAVARLAASNLRGELQGLDRDESAASLASRLTRRLDLVETNLDEVSSKLLGLLKFSQRIGFVRTMTQWNDVVREALIWLTAERRRRGVEVRVTCGDLPLLFIEPNELFGVLVTLFRLTMEAFGGQGGSFEVRTVVSEDGRYVRSEVYAAGAGMVEQVSSIIGSTAGTAEEVSPLHFEWALARETVETQYGGSLTWSLSSRTVCFVLDLPLGREP